MGCVATRIRQVFDLVGLVLGAHRTEFVHIDFVDAGSDRKIRGRVRRGYLASTFSRLQASASYSCRSILHSTNEQSRLSIEDAWTLGNVEDASTKYHVISRFFKETTDCCGRRRNPRDVLRPVRSEMVVLDSKRSARPRAATLSRIAPHP